MMEFALKNITRQKSRTVLTTLGIVIGIAAVVTLGSFAEGINSFFQANLETSTGKIVVMQAGAGGFMQGFQGAAITKEQVDSLLNVDGVEDAVPVNIYFKASGFGPEYVVVGLDADKGSMIAGNDVSIYKGRGFDDTFGESFVMVIGRDLAEKEGWDVGDFVKVKNTDFEVVGILDRINNANVDGSAIVHIEDLQEATGSTTYQMVYVIPKDVRQVESIAQNIKSSDDTLEASTSKDMARQSAEVVGQIRGFTFGMGAIAALVGGLGVLNTMIMAVIERRKEIGVMKAVGAGNRLIMTQIISESSLMSVIGGAVGVGIGMLGAEFLKLVTGGSIPAVVTPGLALASMAFAFALGAVGGFYPALKASKLDPVEALRYE